MDGATQAMAMVWIEPGTFRMGSPPTEPGRSSDEGPRHEVTISRGFWIGQYELTQAEVRSVLNPPDGAFRASHLSPDHPAAFLSWNDVQAVIWHLNEAEGAPVYRLPTEAEWEYACRAGSISRWAFGDDEARLGDYAWYVANAWSVWDKFVHAKGTRQPNRWGLYDMHGNVFEWVQDRYAPDAYADAPRVDPTGPEAGDLRVARGGHLASCSGQLRSARRFRADPSLRSQFLGARLVRQDP